MSTIIFLEEKNWEKSAGLLVRNEILYAYQDIKFINLILTGGKSAPKLYKELNNSGIFNCIEYGNIFLSDERSVPLVDANSNYSMIKKSLFNNIVPNSIKFPEPIDFISRSSIVEYEKLVPSNPDLVLLSLGADGHIASIFNDIPLVLGPQRKLGYVTSRKLDYSRFTVTLKIINSAKKVFVMVEGREKIKSFFKIKNQLISSPASELLKNNNVTWILAGSIEEGGLYD